MALQTAESIPVRYALSRNWNENRLSNYDTLPKDPRNWSREHVAQWLDHVTEQHGLPPVPSTRFHMNGKALCLMSLNMFMVRVPLGGKLLYKDFQLRLSSVLYGAY